MTEADLDKIMQMSSVAIIAPAGHGKTEKIAEIVKHTEGKQLLVTVKAGEAKWRFRPGKTKEELIEHFLAKHGGK